MLSPIVKTNMKQVQFFLFTLSFLLLLKSAKGQEPLKLHANKKAIVTSGNARFTVLTSGLLRMEFSEDKSYDDRASFVVVNRELPVPKYQTKEKKGWLYVKTSTLELAYKLNSGAFNKENLSIRYLKSDTIQWRPGQEQKYNLKGTLRTLDNADGGIDGHSHKKLELGDGILSRDGWYFFDDSSSLRMDNSEWPWAVERKNQGQDWYFIGYGTDYKTALYDFSLIAGKTPMIPRYAFGYWWSRYWSYSDNELRDLVAKFKRFDVPTDVLVVDMDWHKKGWTGWTFNKSLFPDPAGFFDWTNKNNLKTTLNLHPADGVNASEDIYPEFAKSVGFDTTGRKTVPFMVSDKKYMSSLFNVVLKPMEKMGVDFWWLDWQQWPYDKNMTGLSNTWYLNYVFYTEMQNTRKTRPMLYHRWGGLGNHRYQIGFSGDTFISWESLAYQPYITNTASNVLYSYWSHDIGGHQLRHGEHSIDPELYTRWLQYGAFSPIMRTHSTKMGDIKKEIWNYDEPYFDALHDAIKIRYKLVPYIYTMSRKAYDNAIGLCRPMYYDYPKESQAYEFDKQYMFGDNMIISPIGAHSVDDYSKVRVWLPEGNDWYEWHTGTLLKGGKTYERSFAVNEYPIYIKAGSVIPMYGDDVDHLDSNPQDLTIGVFPGSTGNFSLYEDNGNDKNFSSQNAITNISATQSQEKTTIAIAGSTGTYEDMPLQRKYHLKIYGSQMPTQVLVNGGAVTFNRTAEPNTWNYDGDELCLNISLPLADCRKSTKIEAIYGKEGNPNINNGVVEQFKRLHLITSELKRLDNGIYLPETLGSMEETNRSIEYFPEQFNELIRNFQSNYGNLPDIINSINSVNEENRSKLIKKLKVSQ
jgi:alpha-glucosidase (family GH31 glycosyl hydrolase)